MSDLFQRRLLEQILILGSSVPNVISKSVGDQFELCLVKCRTSSKVLVNQILLKVIFEI